MSRFRRHSRKVLIAICAVCTGLVATLHLACPPLRRVETSAQDQLMRIQFSRRSPQRPELVYLAIDNASTQLDGFFPDEIEASPALRLMREPFPWKRTIYPILIDRLVQAGAKVVAFDMLFPSPRENDGEFRAALDKHRDRVVIGANFTDAERGVTLRNFTVPATTLIPQKTPPDDRVGFVNFWPDDDGVVRGALYRTTQLEVSQLGWNPDDPAIDSLAARMLLKSGHADAIPPPGRPWRFRFAGGPGRFKPVSVCDIFLDRNWKTRFGSGSFFRDKIVLVGMEGNWTKDEVVTPYGVMFGAEVHLNAVNAALNHDFLRETSPRVNLALIALAGTLAWLLCRRIVRPLLRFVALVLAAAAWIVAAQFFYNHGGLFILTVHPLIALGSGGVCCLAWDLFREQREKAHVRRTLERYVSKDAVREILDNPASYFHMLGGVRKPVAVLFSDLRGFTSLTEQADSHALVSQLNEYFTEMVEPIHRHGGVLDKFIGDAVMAVWGSIRTRGAAGDVRAAIDAALEMRARLAALNIRWQDAGKKPLAMGIGINFGAAIAGNIGSEETRNLTVIGDAVNLAARIEGVTKEYGLDLLLGEDAAALALDFFHLQTIGLVQVKGRAKPVELFTVLGSRSEPPDEATGGYLRTYGEAMRLYRARDFAAAAGLFGQCASQRAGDPLARIYAERSAAMQSNPPPADWNGVCVTT